uniref:C2H2-type domain-containing protein n=1 Tax=Ciona intestinalis TaxID=7719 RepID=H2XV64_CIOIN
PMCKLVPKREFLDHLYFQHHMCRVFRCKRIYSTQESYKTHLHRMHSQRETPLQSASPDLLLVHDDPLTEDKSNFITNFCKMCIKMKEHYVLPDSTYRCIDMIAFVTVFHQNVLRANINFIHGKDEYLFDSECFMTAWENIQNHTVFDSYCKSIGYVEPVQFNYIPILDTVKEFLSHNDVWQAICNNLPSNQSQGCNYFCDFTDGLFFKNHKYFKGDKNMLRLHFYCDELEVCKPLGRSSKRKNKLTGFYFVVGNIGTRHFSALRNIFLALLIPSRLIKKYGYIKLLEPLVHDIKKLETSGVQVGKTNNFICGTIATLSADNLGAHDIGGFRKCFSSGRICRFCMCSYSDIFVKSSDTEFKERTSEEHAIYVSSLEIDENLAAAYGVISKCALLDIEGFCPTISLPPDIMHDCLEGVIPYFLQFLFRSFNLSGTLLINAVNAKFKCFKFGRRDFCNKPRCLPNDVVQKNGKISLSASEAWCVFRLLPFIVGNCIPVTNENWKLYLLLADIMDVIFAPVVTDILLEQLDYNISVFYSQMLCVAKEFVKPKFHFMLHYARLIQQHGPLRYLWCMRFESYHRKVKKVVNTTKNFKNVCHSVAVRIQRQKCYEQSETLCLCDDYVDFSNRKSIDLFDLPTQVSDFVKSLTTLKTVQSLCCSSTVYCNGTKYCLGDVLIVNVYDECPIFAKLQYILSYYDSIILVTKFLRPSFNSHFHAYCVRETEDYIFVQPGYERYPECLDLYKVDDEKFIHVFHCISGQ